VDVLIGSFTAGTDGRGITRYAQNAATGALAPLGVVVELTNPSYLAWHPTRPWLYAVSETSDGTVHAFGVPDNGELEPRGAQPTGGADPCHLAVDATGRWLLVANYGSGSVAVFPIGRDGALGPRSDLVQHSGSGPDADRQAGPHAHMAQPAPTGDHVIVADLGTDELYAYAVDAETGRLHQADVLRLPAGTGPRHLAFGPDGGALLVGELDSSLTALRAESGVLRPVHRRPATAEPVAARPARNYPSAVRISPDGGYAYVGNRGADCVSVFALDRDGPRPVADVPTGGSWPRDVALIGDFLYVANQDSDTVCAFRIDRDTGVPEPTGAALPVPAPACVVQRPPTLDPAGPMGYSNAE
jgi:6-phosphogluconolactonase (cycloisomerase 2 family)